MYVYRVRYSSFEESPQRYLTHEVKFEPAEFQQMVISALEEIVRRWLDQPVWDENASPDLPWGTLSQFADVVPDHLASYLIKERGFRDIEVAAETDFDGWAQVVPGGDGFPLSKGNNHNQAVTARLVGAGLADAINRKNQLVYDEERRRYGDDDGG